jgi:RNA polymerase sigma-70 factor (ECF subfamily)
MQVTAERPDSVSAPAVPLSPAPVLEPFEAFYRREYPRLVALAYALSGRRAAAEDLAQDAFLTAHQRWGRIGAYEHPEAYVRRVVANAAVSAGRRLAAEGRALRRLAVRSRSEVDDLEPPDAEFWRAVRSLSPRQAQTLALYYLEDRTAEEIAAILGCSVATVSVHLRRGRVALEHVLSKGGGR